MQNDKDNQKNKVTYPQYIKILCLITLLLSAAAIVLVILSHFNVIILNSWVILALLFIAFIMSIILLGIMVVIKAKNNSQT